MLVLVYRDREEVINIGKIERTWSLNEKTVLLTKVLAAIFQMTDSQIVENIIITKSTRTLAVFESLGIGMISPPQAKTTLAKSGKILRKTVALSAESYEKIKKIVAITDKRESAVVEDFVYDTVNTIHSFYPHLVGLIDAALAIKEGREAESTGEAVLFEIYHGRLTDKVEKDIRNNLEELKRAFHRS